MLKTEPPDSDYFEINQYDICDLHAGQPLGSVCLDCEECICDECFRFIHSSHRRQELADYNRTQLKVLEGNRRKLTDITATNKMEVACLTKQIKRCNQKSTLAAKEVEAAVELLFREITSKKEAIIQNMNSNASSCIDHLKQQKQELENRQKQFTLITERIDNVTKSAHPGELFKNVGGLKKHCTGALNQKPLSSPPVFIPEFRVNPTLSSDFENLQIGVVVDSTDQSDDESGEHVYEIEEEEWVYEVEPLSVHSFGVSAKDGDMTNKREDGASAGSSYCEHSGSELNANQTTYQAGSDNGSAGSSYAHLSNTCLHQKRQTPKSIDKLASVCSGISSTESSACILSSKLALCKHPWQHKDLTRKQVSESTGHYSLARPAIASEPGHQTLDDDDNECVYNVIDDHHIGDDVYERPSSRSRQIISAVCC
ncbi:uncharacterized protein LOC117327110 [Pecten maximus]|uniref:uncharacterized protein LOC117327110 n=1 Tax=Pecten maximus TaxID=6579 RepID=UPI001458B78B|nr:uncharacterized protein LOC117327110 [Pecten maximus]